MNFEDLNFAKTSGVSPSSFTSDGTMLQISIPAWSVRASMSPMLGRTPEGPKTHCKLKSEGIRMSIIMPAPYSFLDVSCAFCKYLIGLSIEDETLT